MDPIVIDPPNFDPKAAWKECSDWVDQHEPGSFAGAAGADPGVCSCPACHEMFWAWGRKQRCVKCLFEYPTDAWAMFSWGVQAKWREIDPPPAYKENAKLTERMKRHDAERMWHPYFCYGYENAPPRDSIAPAGPSGLHDYYESLDWKKIMATYKGHEKHEKPKPEEIDPEAAAMIIRAFRAREAIVANLGGPWKRGMPGASGTIECPACKKGKLHFSRAGYNGNIHAKCETEDCVSFME